MGIQAPGTCPMAYVQDVIFHVPDFAGESWILTPMMKVLTETFAAARHPLLAVLGELCLTSWRAASSDHKGLLGLYIQLKFHQILLVCCSSSFDP